MINKFIDAPLKFMMKNFLDFGTRIIGKVNPDDIKIHQLAEIRKICLRELERAKQNKEMGQYTYDNIKTAIDIMIKFLDEDNFYFQFFHRVMQRIEERGYKNL